ncbi:MAG: hypothetical protein IPM47_21285 [Sphingobacteriales bacterium]|nr:MAG: hypothetical protein IPM47_21285 [Sphingobacteriales bacterium]
MTITVEEQVAVLPLTSITVKTTVLEPTSLQSKLLGLTDCRLTVRSYRCPNHKHLLL